MAKKNDKVTLEEALNKTPAPGEAHGRKDGRLLEDEEGKPVSLDYRAASPMPKWVRDVIGVVSENGK